MLGVRFVALVLIAATAVAASPGAAQDEPALTTDQPDMPEIPPDAVEAIEPPAATPEPPSDVDLPEVIYDTTRLPAAVRALRERIMAAASSGDPESLRPIIRDQSAPPSFSFGHVDDPIDYLRALSGDSGGREIMAILLEVLEAGFVHVDEGTPEEAYVWPYFARYPVEALTPRQLVELFKLVYAGDYDDMLAYGYYLSYRLGIGPDGTWRYFIAGD